MDLVFSDAELAFRDEVRAWIADNLPDGWGQPGFKEAQTFEEKLEFAKAWEKKFAYTLEHDMHLFLRRMNPWRRCAATRRTTGSGWGG
jgi:hypothetical protein